MLGGECKLTETRAIYFIYVQEGHMRCQYFQDPVGCCFVIFVRVYLLLLGDFSKRPTVLELSFLFLT